MKVYIFVEGLSDDLALSALWAEWRDRLRTAGHGIKTIPLGDKDKYFRKIGAHAASRLVDNRDDLVVGLPDFYPNHKYHANRVLCHENCDELKEVQKRLVEKGLRESQGLQENNLISYLSRFYPCALKHDLEMLLLAAVDELREHLRTDERLENGWLRPVEDVDQNRPPKRIVEELYRTKLMRAYRDTKDAPAVLGKVRTLRDIIYCGGNQKNCPVFIAMLDWIGTKTGVNAY